MGRYTCQIAEANEQRINLYYIMITIPFLSLHDVTALHSVEINEAVTRVVNYGWYLQGRENETFEANYAKYIGTE